MKKKISWTVLLSLTLGFCGTATDAWAAGIDAPTVTAGFWNLDIESSPKPRFVLSEGKTGMASWYGRRFHGRKTASGERFDQEELTCASRDLPFGTMVEITNLDNGKVAVARVNDRGPFVRHRILDLSYGLAKSLEFLGRGTTRIAYRVIESPDYRHD